VYCGKTADYIRMLFGVVSGVGRGMRVLNGVVIVEEEGAVLGVNVGHPVVTNGIFCMRGRRGSSQITLGFLVEQHATTSYCV